jgi:hypothetical protein
MIETILASLYGIYCLSFCCCAAHQLYQERREERNERMREYNQLRTHPPSREIYMINERQFSEHYNRRLDTIQEGNEDFSV